EPEVAGAGAGLRLDGGDAHHPAGEEEAVDGEERGEGDTEADEGGARRDVLPPGFVDARHKVRLGPRAARGKQRRGPGGEAAGRPGGSAGRRAESTGRKEKRRAASVRRWSDPPEEG